MSYFESKQRWMRRGVTTSEGRRARAPGFGRKAKRTDEAASEEASEIDENSQGKPKTSGVSQKFSAGGSAQTKDRVEGKETAEKKKCDNDILAACRQSSSSGGMIMIDIKISCLDSVKPRVNAATRGSSVARRRYGKHRINRPLMETDFRLVSCIWGGSHRRERRSKPPVPERKWWVPVEASVKEAERSFAESSHNVSMCTSARFVHTQPRSGPDVFYNPYKEVTMIDVQASTLDGVKSWAACVAEVGGSFSLEGNGMAAVDTALVEPDFNFVSTFHPSKRVRFEDVGDQSSASNEGIDQAPITCMADVLLMLNQFAESCDMSMNESSQKWLKETWEKLTVLLWASYVSPNDIVLLRDGEGSLTLPGQNASQQTVEQYSNVPLNTAKLIGRKVLFLHAALFGLFPLNAQVLRTSDAATKGASVDAFCPSFTTKILSLAMKLTPRGYDGMTPLAVASIATIPKTGCEDSDFVPNLSAKKIIEKILELDPTLARIPTIATDGKPAVQRQLPLHLAVQSGKNWNDGIGRILGVFPAAADLADSRGWLPIHAAAASRICPGWVIEKLVQHHPVGASVKDREGRLPLHLATEILREWGAGVESIFAAYPEAAVIPDARKRLPAYNQRPGGKVSNFLNREAQDDNPNTFVTLLLGDLVSKAVYYDMADYTSVSSFGNSLSSSFGNVTGPESRYDNNADEKRDDTPLPSAGNLSKELDFDEPPWLFSFIQPSPRNDNSTVHVFEGTRFGSAIECRQ